MISFKQYILEDVVLFQGKHGVEPDSFGPYTEKFHDYMMKRLNNAKDVNYKNIGSIGDDFDVHHYHYKIRSGWHDDIHNFLVRHKPTNTVVAKTTMSSDPDKNKLSIVGTGVHPQFSAKKIKTSLPIELYKKISDHTGHEIHAGDSQTHGGADLWRRMINDPEIAHRVVLRKSEREIQDRGGLKEIPAHGVPHNQIWGEDDTPSDDRISGTKRKIHGRVLPIKFTPQDTRDFSYVQDRSLVLKPR